MGQVSAKLRRTTTGYMYWCQGCQASHHVNTEGPGPTWGFNGNLEAPTFTPSVLYTSGHFMSGHEPGKRCWCTYNAEHPDKPAPFQCERCHTFIRDGMVEFLADCSHALAGQTHPLPDLPTYLTDNDQ